MDNKIKKTRVKIPSTLISGSVKRQKQWFKKRGIRCSRIDGHPLHVMGRLIPLSIDELRKRRDIISINKKFNAATGVFYNSWKLLIIRNNMKLLCPYQVKVNKPMECSPGRTSNKNLPRPDHCQAHWYCDDNMLGFRKESDLSFYLLKNGHLLT